MSKQNKLSRKKINGWIARNKEDNALIFVPGDEPPTRMSTYWIAGFTWGYTKIDDVFPDLKWEDEPIECEIVITPKNQKKEEKPKEEKPKKEKQKKEKQKKYETPEEGTPEYAKLVEEAWNKLSPEEQKAIANCHCEYGGMVDEYEENLNPCTEYPEPY